MDRRRNLLKDLTNEEAELFRTLTKKYQLTPENFPGLFLLAVEGQEHIETPCQLWQLWLYDQLFETTSFSRIPWDLIEQNFVDKMLKRLFRGQILGKQFAIPLHYYRFQLNKIGLIEFLGDLKELVHPLDFFINNHRDNILLQMHWEGSWEDFSLGGIPDQWKSHYRKKSPYQMNINKYFLKMKDNF
ncbi:hypothetical protein [Brevibacillus porteri]|uniref:Competence protein CoiA C-terminal domain-containing protein n=1 Tax=Brevibacillus porteri TaxID=2126350 RepID=A0ABX5FVJ8_9BACL|nr:hypothetical protein [Brevibacillus porteri]MED1798829.1 hypothetical protein [Brevibacillus porteri]MED2131512.1 hypothetical protein [Brevibacillus porteri]MED2744065.1 hypothetical protein [Brevibacillus porteri]MED2813279.1 hypothetical protein [Brevibacillus porteri]MED2896597.1 hypothetical protein [Brevibacillus porteri]